MRSPAPADGVAVATVLLMTAGTAMTVVATGDVLESVVLGVAYTVGFGAVGWLLWRRVPGNPIGWCFAGSAVTSGVAEVAHGWAALAVAGDIGLGTTARFGAVLDTYGWAPSAVLGACLPLLLLPDGRLLSARWRPVPPMLLGTCLLGLAAQFAVPGRLGTGPFADVVSPFGVQLLEPLPKVIAQLAPLSVLLGLSIGVGLLVQRYRRSGGIHRQQLRWVAAGGACALLGVAIGLPDPQSPVGLVAGVVAANALPVSMGVAVLRYRLYDLGRLVSRTLSYGVLSALLLGTYIALVSIAARVAPDGSSIGVAAATLAAAALFQPLRRRVQAVVDLRFNRARYDAERTIEMFSRTLRDEVDLAAVRADLIDVVHQTVQPEVVGLWLREAGH